MSLGLAFLILSMKTLGFGQQLSTMALKDKESFR